MDFFQQWFLQEKLNIYIEKRLGFSFFFVGMQLLVCIADLFLGKNFNEKLICSFGEVEVFLSGTHCPSIHI